MNLVVGWNNVKLEKVDNIPPIDVINKTYTSANKNMSVSDDYKNIKNIKNQKGLLDRYFGCFSTRHNIFIIITSQDSFSIPASIRRMCTRVMLWKNHDIASMNVLASRFGLKYADLKYMFNHICEKPRDSLLIDTTRKQRLRKNIYEVISFD